MKNLKISLKISLKIFLFLTVLTGVIYPVLITGLAQIAFHDKANGSLIIIDNKTVGSKLIGQKFDSIIYFASRPSAVSYNPLPSGGSNFSLTNLALINLVEERRKRFININKIDDFSKIPSEMVFASASGLDPHISPEAANLQVNRISNVRKFNETQKLYLAGLIKELTEDPQFSFLGEARINVLKLNLEIDKIRQK
jgi:K+-transporting ATPase ATPase C chain